MINGLYSGAAALDVIAKQQEVISNNLMHLNSSGHRRVQAGVSQRFEDGMNSNKDLGPEVQGMKRDFEVGRLAQTDRPLDLAIGNDGFFVFDNGGEEYFSRDGRLFRNPNTNELVNSEGYPIQGENGSITIEPTVSDRDLTVAPDGTISANGVEIGRIETVQFEDNQTLSPIGVTGFAESNRSQRVADPDTQIVQYKHELSNVQAVTELIALITNSRQHDAVQRASRTISEALRDHIRG